MSLIASHQTGSLTTVGAQDTAQKTYASIKAALGAHPELGNKRLDVFLQGSYANSTNIRGDSDVDIVVMLPQTFISDTSRLSPLEKIHYDQNWSHATYDSADLRRDVISALNSYYGANRVEEKNKCIRIHREDGYVDADVVPAIEHRLYRRYTNSPSDYIEGTAIYPRDGGLIVNYPKEHKKNGETKSNLTNGNYKPTVRQIKNLKRHAVLQGAMDPKEAPGYLLECMTYNAPPNLFANHDHSRLALVLDWLMSANYAKFMSGDEVHTLFNTDPGKFSAEKARNIINTLTSQVSWV